MVEVHSEWSKEMSKPRPRFIADEKGRVDDRKKANEQMDWYDEQKEKAEKKMKQIAADPLLLNSENSEIRDMARRGLKKQEYKIRKYGGKAGAGIFVFGVLSWKASYNTDSLGSLMFTVIAIVLCVIGGVLMLDGTIATWKDGA